MYEDITREQMKSEQERMRRDLAQYVNELTDNGKLIAAAFVDLMEGKNPETPLHIRIASARDLIQISESVPVAPEHIRTAETLIAQYDNPQ